MIRPAAREDVEALLAIEKLWPTTPGWNREHFLHEISSERSYFFVLESEGKVLGYAGCLKIAPEAQITTIAVSPGEARKGSGRLLLNHLVDAARRWGYSQVTLEVSARNAAARSLYGSAGFQIVGRRPKFYNDGSDAVLMDLDLK